MANEIRLFGTVGGDFFGEEFFTASEVAAHLKSVDGDVTVRINSGGGVAPEGQTIHNLLRDHDGEVHVIIDGIAASAASLIAMAGDRITMRRGSIMLVHDPASMFTEGRGTASDHMHTAAFLDTFSRAYASVYAARTGRDEDSVRDIMRAETLFTGQEAVDAGFADDFEDAPAQKVAAFDYRIYASAPKWLREAGSPLGEVKGKEAVMAMIAGLPRTTKEAEMADDIKVAAASPAVEDKTRQPEMAAKPVEKQEAKTVAPAPAVEMKQDTAPSPVMTAHDTARLFKIAMKAGVDADFVSDLVTEGVTMDVALDRVTQKWAEADPMPNPTKGPSMRIVRDERDTRRQGMADALVAQMSRKDPADDKARPYMGMSLVDMAAVCADYRGEVRTVRGRDDVFMAASHSTSDFPSIFENALNKQLASRYLDAQPTYQRIAARRTFTDFRPHPIVRTGDFPEMQEIGQGGEIKFGTFGEAKETVAVKSYAVGVRISRQMLINDDLDAISQVIADRGMAVARFEDRTFYAMLLSGAGADGPSLLETSRQVFNTTDSTKAGTAAAITVASLSAGRAALRKRTGLDGAKLNVTASVLLVGPDKETEAQQIVAPVQAQQAGNVNPFSGTLQIVTTAEITGNAWYLMADPASVPNFVYGYLSGFEAPRLRMDEPFGQQGTALTVEHDFGVGAIDFRGGWKNAGA